MGFECQPIDQLAFVEEGDKQMPRRAAPPAIDPGREHQFTATGLQLDLLLVEIYEKLASSLRIDCLRCYQIYSNISMHPNIEFSTDLIKSSSLQTNFYQA